MMEEQEPRLKACPFCGGEAVMQAPNMHRVTCISCSNCMASTKWGKVEVVMEAWNRRAGEEGKHENYT